MSVLPFSLDSVPPRGELSSRGVFDNAPLAWLALAVTGGIVGDRTLIVPIPFALALAGASLVAWLLVRSARRIAPGFLLLAAVSLGAAYHHVRQHVVDPGDIRRLATAEGAAAHLRGRLVAPVQSVPGNDDPLLAIPRPDATKLLIDINDLLRNGMAERSRGRIVAYVQGHVGDIYPGDEIELQGKLILPRNPSNPGEFDQAQELRDQGVGAILSINSDRDAVRLVARRWPGTLFGWLGRLHAACKSILDERLGAQRFLAAALLLGDGSGLKRPEWEKFLQSGVVHALAISGQHLVVLAGFLVVLRRGLFIRRAPATIAIVAFLISYALLTGGRAPAMRAAWMVLVVRFAFFLKRPASGVNTLAFAWLTVLLFNPADCVQMGCQLSFLAVALLCGVINPWLERPIEPDPFAAPESDSITIRWSRNAWRAVRNAYLANALLWFAVTPLVAERFHVVSPIALLIGPPVVVATSFALVSGFSLLLTAPVFGPLAAPLVWATDWSLRACETMIDLGLRLPGAWFTLGDLPLFWIVLFYLGILVPFVWPRLRTLWLVPAGFAWLAFGLMLGLGLFRSPEFRVAFLSVGHGGCTVIETGSGRVLVYDAGAFAGPDITRRIIIPYLWSRGLRRIDELFVSHADLDHYNGVPELIERFPVGRVTLTPSFDDRRTPGARQVEAVLKARQIPKRTLKAGDGEQFDDIKLDILHPPAVGPEGKENARSMVVLVRQSSFSLLLTGDLEDAGLENVLALNPPGIDILMAPHHGGRLANPAALASWSRPKLALASQGRPRNPVTPAPIYEAVGARYLSTYDHGAVLITFRDNAIWIETVRTKQSFRLGSTTVR